MRLTMRMTGGIKECERLYRLMCFNVFIGNRDDHAKNFSYLHDAESGAWSLSPAYDLTENPGINGEHTTAVNGKGRGITVEDMADIGMKAASHEPDAYRLRGTCANASRMPVLPYATEGGPNTFERTRPHRKSIQRKRSSSRASRRAWCGCGRASGSRIRQVFHWAELSAPLISGKEVNVSNVTFEAGCRNNWHIHHKACQILIAVGGAATTKSGARSQLSSTPSTWCTWRRRPSTGMGPRRIPTSRISLS